MVKSSKSIYPYVIYILLFIICVVIFIIFMITQYYLNKREKENQTKKATIMLFSSSCCKTGIRPMWNRFINEYEGKIINGYKLKVIEHKCEGGKNPMMKEYGIQRYPTIVLMRNGKRIDYIDVHKHISVENMKNFVNSQLNH